MNTPHIFDIGHGILLIVPAQKWNNWAASRALRYLHTISSAAFSVILGLS
jgi:hypothetical protein